VPCADVRQVDFHNFNIAVGDAVLKFRNGVATLYEDGTEGAPQTEEWEATIKREFTIDVAPARTVRFILIDNVHVNGSGSRFYLVGYGCLQRKMKRVFEREGFSLAIVSTDTRAVVVALTIGPAASTTRFFSYVWNDKASHYELNSTWVRQ
jgi:hypothetical protein